MSIKTFELVWIHTFLRSEIEIEQKWQELLRKWLKCLHTGTEKGPMFFNAIEQGFVIIRAKHTTLLYFGSKTLN